MSILVNYNKKTFILFKNIKLLNIHIHSFKHSLQRTPLHWACYYGNHACVSLLLKGGANSLTPDCRGQTPLHLSVLPGVPHSPHEAKKDTSDAACVLKLLQAAPSIISWRVRDHCPVLVLV